MKSTNRCLYANYHNEVRQIFLILDFLRRILTIQYLQIRNSGDIIITVIIDLATFGNTIMLYALTQYVNNNSREAPQVTSTSPYSCYTFLSYVPNLLQTRSHFFPSVRSNFEIGQCQDTMIISLSQWRLIIIRFFCSSFHIFISL